MSEKNKDPFIKDALKVEVSAQYSLLGFIDKIVPALLLCSYSLFILMDWSQPSRQNPYDIDINRLYLKQIFQYGNHSFLVGILALAMAYLLYKIFMGKKIAVLIILAVLSGVIAFLSFKVNPRLDPLYVKYTLLSIATISGLYSLYFVLYVKTSKIELSKRQLMVKTGVIATETDSTNTHQIKDVDKKETAIERILGLERVIFAVKQAKDVKVLRYLAKKDAEAIFDFLTTYTYDSSVEYWGARDRVRGGEVRQRPGLRNLVDDGNQGDDDGDQE